MLSKKVVDALGNATDYEYDTAGRATKTVSPDAGTTTYTYNTTDTLATKTDAGNATISYRYDVLNRLTTIDFPTDVDITYTYDDCTNGKGRVCTMTDQAGTTEYEYDKLGRVVKEKKTILGVTYITSYSYDKAGTLKSVTLPSGRQLTYTYDKGNRPAGVIAKLKNTTVLASSIAYDLASNLTSITLGNGLTQSQTYNAARRISTISVPGVMSLSYGYDPIGNITNIVDAHDPAKSKTYTYDSLDRLASAMGPWGTLAWTYDANGNRLAQGNGANYTYTYNANRLTTVSNGHIDYYQYDQNGNTTNDGQKDFVYNQNQRLIGAELDGKTFAEYTYNGNGQRVIKKTGPAQTNSASTQNTVYHFDLNGKLIAETAGNGKMIAEYVYLDGQPLAIIAKQANNERTYYYHNDHLGTPQKITDSSGSVVWSADYKPFGEATVTISTITSNLRFPGQYYDAETGLHQNWRRDYNFSTGRYIEKDPIGLRGGNNLYRYSKSNPIRYIDPKGLFQLHLNNATSQQIAAINQAISMLNNAANNPCSGASNYFNLFNVNLSTILQSGQGPDVYIDNMSYYGYYNTITNNIVINQGILSDPQAIASTLIHETGHWADDISSLVGDLDPDISGVPSFDSPDPDDGPYGYAAEVSTFGNIY